MARAGILYSHVAQAAAQLAEAGKNPTVDNVRTALGSTGSKSTIAPLLKRWKAENQAIAAQAEVGLPPTLLDAMKGVYDQLQEEVNRKLEEVRQAHEADRQAAAAHAQRLAADHQALATTHAGLSREMEQTRSVLERLEAAHRESILSLATAQSENSGLQQRLADRAAEMAALRRQLEQTRAQFDHYQEATALQRSEERQIAEQRCMRLEQELSGVRQRLGTQESHIGKQEAQLSYLNQENATLRETIEPLQAALAQARTEHEQRSYELASLGAAHQECQAAALAAQQALTETRLALAARDKEVQLLNAHLAQAEERVALLDRQRLSLLEECAALRARLPA